MMKKEIIVDGFFDLYDLVENKITKKDLWRDNYKIYKGFPIILDTQYSDEKNYVLVDYIEFCDRNNQLVYACLEDLRDKKLKELLYE
jgi:hypothetical protein